MDKKEIYRQVFDSFKELCAKGEQVSSFAAYCRQYGVDHNRVRQTLKDEFQKIMSLPGYVYNANSRLYAQIYESFKELCAQGRQPGSFSAYCRSFGVTRAQVYMYLKNRKLKVVGLPGYVGPCDRCRKVPFEDVIFEEAGFLPAGSGNAITVRVDGHVAVSFPADTDVAVIAKFVKKLGKEVGHVES